MTFVLTKYGIGKLTPEEKVPNPFPIKISTKNHTISTEIFSKHALIKISSFHRHNNSLILLDINTIPIIDLYKTVSALYNQNLYTIKLYYNNTLIPSSRADSNSSTKDKKQKKVKSIPLNTRGGNEGGDKELNESTLQFFFNNLNHYNQFNFVKVKYKDDKQDNGIILCKQEDIITNNNSNNNIITAAYIDMFLIVNHVLPISFNNGLVNTKIRVLDYDLNDEDNNKFQSLYCVSEGWSSIRAVNPLSNSPFNTFLVNFEITASKKFFIFIGLVNKNFTFSKYLGEDKNSFGLLINDGSFWFSGMKEDSHYMKPLVKKGDIVTMHIDLIQKSLAYSLNSSYCGIVRYNIGAINSLFPAVTMFDLNDRVTIIPNSNANVSISNIHSFFLPPPSLLVTLRGYNNVRLVINITRETWKDFPYFTGEVLKPKKTIYPLSSSPFTRNNSNNSILPFRFSELSDYDNVNEMLDSMSSLAAITDNNLDELNDEAISSAILGSFPVGDNISLSDLDDTQLMQLSFLIAKERRNKIKNTVKLNPPKNENEKNDNKSLSNPFKPEVDITKNLLVIVGMCVEPPEAKGKIFLYSSELNCIVSDSVEHLKTNMKLHTATFKDVPTYIYLDSIIKEFKYKE